MIRQLEPLTQAEAKAALEAISQMTEGNANDFTEWRKQTSGAFATWKALRRAEAKLTAFAYGRGKTALLVLLALALAGCQQDLESVHHHDGTTVSGRTERAVTCRFDHYAADGRPVSHCSDGTIRM